MIGEEENRITGQHPDWNTQTLALLLAVGIQTLGGVWWAATLTQKIATIEKAVLDTNLTTRVVVLEEELKRHIEREDRRDFRNSRDGWSDEKKRGLSFGQ